MKIDLYNYTDYRKYLKDLAESDLHSWGIWGRLAKAASCQPTYLSQAIKGKVQLTADHIIGIGQFFKLTDSEIDYLLLLLEFSRAATQKLQQHLSRKINKIRKDREDLTKRLNKPKIETGEKETLYYSAWYWSAIHVLVTIPEYKTASAIAERLLLPEIFVEQCLEQLAFYGILKKEKNEWTLGVGDVHLPKESLMTGVHHNNWRQKAILDSTLQKPENIHYTAVYSLSKKDLQTLKEKMLDLIEQSRQIVGPSKEEELACFICDLFVV